MADKPDVNPTPVTLFPVVDPTYFIDAAGCSCGGTSGQGAGGSCDCGTANGAGS